MQSLKIQKGGIKLARDKNKEKQQIAIKQNELTLKKDKKELSEIKKLNRNNKNGKPATKKSLFPFLMKKDNQQ